MRRSIKGQLISTPAENQIHMVMLPKISLEPLPLNPILKSKSLLTPPPLHSSLLDPNMLISNIHIYIFIFLCSFIILNSSKFLGQDVNVCKCAKLT